MGKNGVIATHKKERPGVILSHTPLRKSKAPQQSTANKPQLSVPNPSKNRIETTKNTATHTTAELWEQQTWGRHLIVVALLGGTTQTTGSAGGDETNLSSGGRIAAGRGGTTNMLVVTATEGVLYGVHGNTTNARPAVTLDAVLVVGTASLEHGLVGTASASDDADHSTAGGLHGLLGAGRQADARLAGFLVVGHDGAVVTGRTRELPAVTRSLLHVAHNGT